MARSDPAGCTGAAAVAADGTACSSWTVWELEASVTVTDPRLLGPAESIVRSVVSGVDLACSRFRDDSELIRLQPRMPHGVPVSPMFRLLLERALDAAALTGGDVDPTLGADLAALGHGPGQEDGHTVTPGHPGIRSIPVPAMPSTPVEPAPRAPGWSRLHLDANTLTLPADLRLDLGASAKAVAADLAAAEVYRRLGCGVLVGLGGDIAGAGPGPLPEGHRAGGDAGGEPGQWQILLQDLPSDPAQYISLAPGFALATSSTQKRRWVHHGTQVHHILDPRFGLPAEAVWRTVTVAAPACLDANALSTAAIVRGFAAVEWFQAEGIPARLVDSRGRVTSTGGWPAANAAPVEAAGTGGAHHG
jgi:thiamine biosynthesis lipoprotein